MLLYISKRFIYTILANYSIIQTDIETKSSNITFNGLVADSDNAIECGNFLYTTSYDRKLIKWDINTTSKLYEYNIDAFNLETLGNKIYVSVVNEIAKNYYISEIDTDSNIITKNYTGSFPDRFQLIKASSFVLYATNSQGVTMWDINTGEYITETKTVSFPYSLSIIKDKIYTSYNRKFIEKWDLKMVNKETIEDACIGGSSWGITQGNLIILGSIFNNITIFNTDTYDVKELTHDIRENDHVDKAYLHNNILYVGTKDSIKQLNIEKSKYISNANNTANNNDITNNKSVPSIANKLKISLVLCAILILI
ncbi:hypothetical protein HDU92_008463 [Lobulomyces angularis]|nr:hypothetical protein HDU92_008463 [Lobulomyces angularis]